MLEGEADVKTSVVPDGAVRAGVPARPVAGEVTVEKAGAGVPMDVRNPSMGVRFMICIRGVIPR